MSQDGSRPTIANDYTSSNIAYKWRKGYKPPKLVFRLVVYVEDYRKLIYGDGPFNSAYLKYPYARFVGWGEKEGSMGILVAADVEEGLDQEGVIERAVGFREKVLEMQGVTGAVWEPYESRILPRLEIDGHTSVKL